MRKKIKQATQIENNPGTDRFIFVSSSSRRWNLFMCIIALFVILSFVFLFISGLSIYFNPDLPDLNAEEAHNFADIRPSDINNAHTISTSSNTPSEQMFLNQNMTNNQEVYAFYVNWDKKSELSLRRHIKTIDVLIPQWFRLDHHLKLESHVQKNVAELAKKHHVKVIPLVNNERNGGWDQKSIHRLLRSPEERATFINELHRQIKKHGYDGINIDFEAIQESDREAFTGFMKELYRTFHADGLSVLVDVPPNDEAFDYKQLEKYSDRIVFMLYDENQVNPGPIASAKWFKENLSLVSKDKMIAGLGNYGYDWDWESEQAGKPVSFEDVTRLADKANLKIQWDDLSQTPYVTYNDRNRSHEVWFLDSVTFHNQLKTAAQAGVNRVALWRLGTEDPSVWDVLEGRKTKQLMTVKNGDNIYSYGQGNIFRAGSGQEEGKRRLHFDGSGLITSEAYMTHPKAFELERLAQPSGKEIVLTFDDGPDTRYTERVLNILKRHQVKAAFFLVGKNAMLNPDLVKKIDRDGHEIGIHTFSHPNSYKLPENVLKFELNATERIIQGITGHSTLLYRSPYGDEKATYDPAHFKNTQRITQKGYITVNYDIDSRDWEQRSSRKIADDVVSQASRGDIILLHDGGGDKTATIQALPEIIERLKKQGYRFVTPSELINKKRADVMPAITQAETPLMLSIKVVLSSVSGINDFIYILLYGVLGLLLLRLVILLSFALKQKRRTAGKRHTERIHSYHPFVSVVIPAYNEERVIGRTIESVLKSDHSNLEIIVVDDGSTDRTAGMVSDYVLSHEHIRLIRQENSGKTSAVNTGFRKAKGHIVVAIDADTVVSPRAVSSLVRHFADEQVAAVSGNIRVGNRRNFLTLWQYLEYVIGFNLEKRAYDALNCVTVVPGAIGAWRKKAVEALGYFTPDTLAEDTDMTLALLRKGYKAVIEERAVAYTEAPETIGDFLKQRYRWIFGTLQCLWKHKKALCRFSHKSLGYIALPGMLLFQVFIPLFAPILDVLFVAGLVLGHFSDALLVYACYFTLDLAVCVMAFRLEKLSLKPLAHLFLQRIFYRYLLLFVSWKSLFSAVKGTRVGWNKLNRTGYLADREVV
ncbi:glycosyltransferase [Sporolactobacillus sp. THM7-7]|nr:glycosyltransferase [Sporolactobacillus sp. THM7-7]